MLTLLFYAEKCYHENERAEICLAFREMLKVALQVPDHKLVISIYQHLGIYFSNTQNYGAAIKAFQKMRDTAEDFKTEDLKMKKTYEMDAYLNIGRVLENQTEYKQGLLAFKRLL